VECIRPQRFIYFILDKKAKKREFKSKKRSLILFYYNRFCGFGNIVGGKAVISGIINARAEEVKSAYSDAFDTVEILCRGEWTAMLLTKKTKQA